MADDDPPQRMVLCLVADEEVIERFPTAVRYFLVGLIDEPVDVILIVPEHPRAGALAAGPVHVIPYKQRPWIVRRWFRQYVVGVVRDRIEQIRKDAGLIVHGLSLGTAPLAAAIAEAIRADLVLHVTSTAIQDDPESTRELARANVLIAPCERIGRAIQEAVRVKAAPRIVPFGLVAENAPAAFCQPGNAPALICAGALRPETGVDVLLRAAPLVLREHPNLLLFICGKGPAETDLRALAASLGLSQSVTFTGRLDRLRAAIRSADLFCLPAVLPVFREEPIHALAAGLVLVAAEGSPYDGWVDRQNVLLFPDRDEFGLARQINHALEHPDASRALAATGQAHARSRHSVSGMVADTIRIYRDLLRRRETLPLVAGKR